MTQPDKYVFENEYVHVALREDESAFEVLFFGLPILGNRLLARVGKHRAILREWNIRHGRDRLGEFEELMLEWVSENNAARTFAGHIRFYDQFIVMETVNQYHIKGKKKKHLFGHPYLAFPSFEGDTWQDDLSMLSYKRQAPFNFPEQWQGKVTDSLRDGKHAPLIVTNGSYQTLILSPLDHFLYNTVSICKTPDAVRCGLPRALKQIPTGTSCQTLIVYGQGVNRTMALYGELMRKQYGVNAVGLQADASLRYISYWTNAGSAYWYKAHKRSTYEETLSKLKKHHDRIGLPIGLYQLDSWWYRRDGNHYISGITEWEPKEEVESKNFNSMLPILQAYRKIRLFSEPRISHVQKLLNTPIATHFKQISNESVYVDRFEFLQEDFAVPRDYDNAHALFKQLFDHPKWRLSMVIHDWLHLMAMNHSAFKDIRIGPDYFRALDDALRELPSEENETGHITLQLCMQLPSMTLQAVTMPSVTSIRSTSDSNSFLVEGTKRWWWHVYSSLFIHAMGKYSFFDNRFTYKTHWHPYASHSTFEMIWMGLNCGPIGIGDRMGKENTALLRRVVNTSGEIIKPDFPSTPLDRCFLYNPHHRSETRGFTLYSSSKVDDYFSYYLLSFNCHPYGRTVQMEFSLNEIDRLAEGEYVLYDYLSQKATCTNDRQLHRLTMKRRVFFYHIVSPFVHGRALIGDVSKHVAMSGQILKHLRIERDRMVFTVSYSPSSQCHWVIYTRQRPARMDWGQIRIEEKSVPAYWTYDGKNHLLHLYHDSVPSGDHTISVEW